MKPKSIITSMGVCMLSFALSYGQSSLDKEGNGSPVQEKKKEIRKMNIIKVNIIPSLFIKNYSFQYERVISKHFSIALGARFMPNTGIPFKDKIIEVAELTDEDAVTAINNFKMSNFALTPELRFYLSKKGYGRGFYIAPYYRYASFKSDELPIGYTDVNDQQQTITLKGDIKTNSGGLMIGAQWFLGKVVTLDWWIGGAHYGVNKGVFTGISSKPLTPDEQTEIRNTIDDFDIPLLTKTTVVNAKRCNS